ncbi:hypothetical protein EAO77_12730 [Streptomyces sp. t39]|nr:hypothetical protein EAO77_12730 [Streptomyces sp. t39]
MHSPSSVATLCVFGILPFGLAHSGGRACQNRVTGDPRTSATAYLDRTIRRDACFPPEDLLPVRLLGGFRRTAGVDPVPRYEPRHREGNDSCAVRSVR